MPAEMTATLMAPDDTEGRTLPGDLVRNMRLQRHMSQRMLAARSGIDPSTISRLERGLAGTTTLTVLSRLADGLGCAPEELMSATASSSGTSRGETAAENLIDLQRSLIGTTLDESATPRTPPSSAREQIAAVRQMRMAGQYRQAAAAAARALPIAHIAATALHERKQARVRLVHLCFDASVTARDLGDVGTAWIAAERCQEVAGLTRQPVLRAGATFARAYAALGRNLPSRSRQIVESFLAVNEPESPELAALSAMLHMTAALAITRSRGLPADRDRHVARAERALIAARTDTDPFGVAFTAEAYWQWRMNMELESRDFTAATDALAHINLDKIHAPQRQAVYFVDLARLYAVSDRPESAAGMLARADRLATEFVAHHGPAQRLRSYLAARDRSSAPPQLRVLRQREGVAV